MSQQPSQPETHPPMLIGHGYDLHRLEPLKTALTGGNPGFQDQKQHARPLVIGGIVIQHDRGPVGHSDGDALMHAITDAILGALGMPDIGQLFPDTDPRWAGADSALFLSEAIRAAHEQGWVVGNVDATLVLQRPKVAVHKDAIRQNLARLLEVPQGRANLKAKTHEGVDAVGEGRAIEAHAVALLVRR